MKRILAIGAILTIVSLIGTVFAVPALAHSSEVGGDISGVYLDQPTLTRVAQVLGLTPDKLASHLQDGETLAEIAGEQGVSEDAVVAAIIAPYRDELKLRVTYGYITQEQADQFLGEAEKHARTLLNQNLTNPDTYNEWEEMEEYCENMMQGWGYGSSSWHGMGGMMGPSHMMGGFGSHGYQNYDPNYVPSASRGFGVMMSGWGHSFSRGWGNMMRGLGGWGGMMSGGMMGW